MIIHINNPDIIEALVKYANDTASADQSEPYDQAVSDILYWYLLKAGDQIFELEKLNRKQGA